MALIMIEAMYQQLQKQTNNEPTRLYKLLQSGNGTKISDEK